MSKVPTVGSPFRCFNPRTREGCDANLEHSQVVAHVSIHAPVKGAIVEREIAVVAIKVSIHAPVKGAIDDVWRLRASSKSFNPRTREGCDTNRAIIKKADFRFNPRTREGCDTNLSNSLIGQECFNPRTREGCDDIDSQLTAIQSVSIHAPVKGAILLWFASWSCWSVSIHAPVKGAIIMADFVVHDFLFQSTHP